MVFFNFWKVNQYVNYNEPAFVVVPTIQQYSVRVQIPSYKAGKIKVGQKALIRLNEYPFEEFGVLTASVKDITSVPLDSFYLVHLTLDNGMKTTLSKTIEARPLVSGAIEIVTRKRNLLQRILEGLYGMTYK